jgi:putative ABC transport system permease protein
MLRNYLTIAIRMLVRNRVQSAINIGGLALGLAGCLMILSYVRYERSYDSWLADSARVYQVQTIVHPPGQPDVRSQLSPFPVYEQLPGAFPQIEAITSVQSGKTVTERDGQPIFVDVLTVDADFFKVFALPFLHGSAATALSDPQATVMTESQAIRLFGTSDVLGRMVTFGAGDGKRPVRVTGVLRDLPPNSSLRVGLLRRRDMNQVQPEARGWGVLAMSHYVKLRSAADAAVVSDNLSPWAKRIMPPVEINGRKVSLAQAGVFEFKLAPITSIHLGNAQDGAETPGGDPRALATFTIVALLTLAMAVVNFVNLSTARAIQRAREVALRKVFGASRGQLACQFMVESLLVSGIAMLLALTLTELLMPWIAQAVGAEMRLVYLGPRGMLPVVAILFALTALAGGLYPAFAISRANPAPVLHANRGSSETAGSGLLRSLLVVAQFAIAIGLIVSTVVIWSQTRFIEQADPGYRRDGLIQIANAWRFTQGSEYVAARTVMLGIPGVTMTGRTSLGLGSDDTSPRLTRAPGAGEYITMTRVAVDADFLATTGVRLLAGRMLGDAVATDKADNATPAALRQRGLNVVVSRSAAVKFGFRAPPAALGQTIQVAFEGMEMVPATIVGVVDDIRFRSAHDPIAPTVYIYDPTQCTQVLVRFRSASPSAVMGALNRIWRQYEPEIPFEAQFVDDISYQAYAAERGRMALFAAFAAMGVLIACLGLYALAAHAAERRTKEIGIRKVLGASVPDIVRLLAWQFSKPVVVANLIAWPVAWWAMRDWLNQFDLRIPLTVTPFLLAGVLALAIALFTVAGHTMRVARVRPVHALRHE